ncbi:MAG: PAS domain-containing protein [Deltaproteobacteria bacterium]|nr:PAS domain-containing protein [Deltaproteobacteria bacterium]
MADEDHLNLCVNDFIASEIIRSMSDGLLVFDFHGRILSINPAALELLNLQWEDIRDKTYADLFLNDSANDEFSDVLLSCIRNRQTRLRKEVPYQRSDGQLQDLAVTTSLLGRDTGDEKGGGVVMVLKDISDFKALDRARRRVLDHLSHELKTPLSIIKASLKRDAAKSHAAMERIERNLQRLQEIQMEVEDIVKNSEVEEHYPFRRWLDQIVDLAESLAEGESSCGETLKDLRGRVESLFHLQGPEEDRKRVKLGTSLQRVLETARNRSAHRRLEFAPRLEGEPELIMNPVHLEKALMAPIKNAIENTPDGGIISVGLKALGETAQVEIRDTGVGITEESQKQIFGGFYHARDTNLYSTRRPFDFDAGGKGLDLLRLRIFADVYGFRIDWESTRCRYIPREIDLCPGDTEKCPHIRDRQGCFQSGGTTFRLVFPVSKFTPGFEGPSGRPSRGKNTSP